MVNDPDIQQKIGAQEYKTVNDLKELLALYETGQVDRDLCDLISVVIWNIQTFGYAWSKTNAVKQAQ